MTEKLCRNRGTLVTCVLVFFMGLLLLVAIPTKKAVAKKNIVLTHGLQTKSTRLQTILPAKYAVAIAKTDHPEILAAIAYRETVRGGYDHTAFGDQGRSKGLFQIQERHWGHVPDDIEGQVNKANTVFNYLVKKHGKKEAVRRWNGSGPRARAYQRYVLNMAKSLKGES